MNLASPRQIRQLLAERGLQPNRSLGQNFLINRNILNAIVAAAEIAPSDRVLEVGPGLGILTEALLATAEHVTAIEKDAGLHQILTTHWPDEPRLELIHGDALELDHASLRRAGTSHMVSNLPYSVGTRVLVDAVTQPDPYDCIVILVQREVAERITANAGTDSMGTLAIWVQQIYRAEILRQVKPTCFWPRPEITSSLVRLQRHADYPLDPAGRDRLFNLVRIAYQQRRKQLVRTFRDASSPYRIAPTVLQQLLQDIGTAPDARAETLGIAEWHQLTLRWPT